MTQATLAIQTRENLTGGNVKGGIIHAHAEWVRQYHGDDALASVVSTLDGTVRGEIENAVATSWCSFHSLIAFDRAVEERFGRGRNLMRELGRFSAYHNLSTTYRLHRRSEVMEFFRRSAVLHTQFQDFGRIECHQLGATACEMRHVDARCFSPLYCASALGYYEQVIVMHGGTPLNVAEVHCQCLDSETCVFRLRWE